MHPYVDWSRVPEGQMHGCLSLPMQHRRVYILIMHISIIHRQKGVGYVHMNTIHRSSYLPFGRYLVFSNVEDFPGMKRVRKYLTAVFSVRCLPDLRRERERAICSCWAWYSGYQLLVRYTHH